MTTEALLKALARLRVETGSLACLGCGYEHNCGVNGCALLSEAWDKLDYLRRREDALYDEVKELWVEVNSRGNALRAAEQKRAEAEDEMDALLGELRKSGCTYCKYATVCVDELSAFGQEDCDRCGKRESCVCLTCSGYGSETDKWQWRGLPEAPEEGEKA